MSDFVNSVDSIGDEALARSIIDRSIQEIRDNYTTSIGNYAFKGCSELITAEFPSVTSIDYYAFQSCSALTTVNFPNATIISSYSFDSCSALTTVNFPLVTKIYERAFQSCSALTTVNFPNATRIRISAFQSCSSLKTADFPLVKSIDSNAFYYCTALKALILRSETMATLNSTMAFMKTKIASGAGYIYVPAALVDSYKAASNWSTYANQFRAIEDYTVDGTITGALDETKI